MLSSLARGGQSAARAAARRVVVETPPSARRAPAAAARRSMGGHARDIGLPGQHLPMVVGKVHKNLGTAYLATMFLWMMYRAKQDGLALIVSFYDPYAYEWFVLGRSLERFFFGGWG